MRFGLPLLLLAAVACGGTPVAPEGFGNTCTSDADCQAVLRCVDFGARRGLLCANTCREKSECSAGSLGQECGFHGYCVP